MLIFIYYLGSKLHVSLGRQDQRIPKSLSVVFLLSFVFLLVWITPLLYYSLNWDYAQSLTYASLSSLTYQVLEVEVVSCPVLRDVWYLSFCIIIVVIVWNKLKKRKRLVHAQSFTFEYRFHWLKVSLISDKVSPSFILHPRYTHRYKFIWSILKWARGNIKLHLFITMKI